MKGTATRDAKGWMVKYPRGVRGLRFQKRCSSQLEAERLLNAIRFHDDQGTLDWREFTVDTPLAFDQKASEFLAYTLSRVQSGECKDTTWRAYTLYITRAVDAWGDRSVKSIQTSDIDGLAEAYQAASKSKANLVMCIHAMWNWMVRKDILRPGDVPRFPTVKYQLGVRKTVTKETQTAILERIKERTFEKNPKIWLGIKWLMTYVCLRPGDLYRIRECDIDRRNRLIWIRDPKATEAYQLALTKTDVETLLRVLPGESEAPFFRDHRGKPFAARRFYAAWKDACKDLGVEGVDLYGGTRHSSVQALRFTHSPEQIKGATMHRTSRAFERYYRVSQDDLRAVYEQAEKCTTCVPPVHGSVEA